jgi:hypothetical protein
MVMGIVGLGNKNDCADEDHQKFSHSTNLKEKFIWEIYGGPLVWPIY